MTDEKAFEVPMNDCGLTITTGRDGSWLHFSSKSGLHASINIEVMAEERRSIISAALKHWCEDRQEQAGRTI